MPKVSQLANGGARDHLELTDPFCGSDRNCVPSTPKKACNELLYNIFDSLPFKEPLNPFHSKAMDSRVNVEVSATPAPTRKQSNSVHAGGCPPPLRTPAILGPGVCPRWFTRSPQPALVGVGTGVAGGRGRAGKAIMGYAEKPELCCAGGQCFSSPPQGILFG